MLRLQSLVFALSLFFLLCHRKKIVDEQIEKLTFPRNKNFKILSDLLILFSEVYLLVPLRFFGKWFFFFLKLLTFAYRNTVKKYYLEIFSVRNNALGENI